jgi:hypothetical protein
MISEVVVEVEAEVGDEEVVTFIRLPSAATNPLTIFQWADLALVQTPALVFFFPRILSCPISSISLFLFFVAPSADTRGLRSYYDVDNVQHEQVQISYDFNLEMPPSSDMDAS